MAGSHRPVNSLACAGYECVYEAKRHKPGIRAGAIETIYKRLGNNSDQTAPRSRQANASLDALERAVFESKQSGRQSIGQQILQSGDFEDVDDGASDSPSPSSPRAEGGMIQVDLDGSSTQHFNYSQQLPPEGNNTFNDLGNEDDEAYPQLPPLESIEAIVTLYFSHVHPWIPMLNQDRFRNRLRYPAEMQRLDVILHAMYVSVHRYLPENAEEGLPNVSYPAWPISSLRRWVVTTAMDNLSIQGLQALIIIAFDDVRCNPFLPFSRS